MNSPKGSRLDVLRVGKCSVWESGKAHAVVAASQVLPVASFQGNLVFDVLDGPDLSGRVSFGLESGHIGVGISGSAIFDADGEIVAVVSHDGHWTDWDIRSSDFGWRCLFVAIHMDTTDCD